MKTIAGVVTENDNQGNLHKITIDLKKHPEAIAPLKELGLINEIELKEIIAANPERYMTVNEAKRSITTHIKKLYAKNSH